MSFLYDISEDFMGFFASANYVLCYLKSLLHECAHTFQTLL